MVRRHRSWRVGLAPLALALAVSVAACGDRTPTLAPIVVPTAVASVSPSPSPSSTPAGQDWAAPSIAAFATCSLLTTDMVTVLLGKAPAGTPTEFDGGPNNKLCTWLTDSAQGTPNELDLGVFVKASPTDKAFGTIPAAKSPEPVAGVGDTAEYAAVGGATGAGSQLIQASKGRAAISMTVHYGGSLPAPGSTKAALITAAQAVLAALGG